ncbi:hypothetical protein BGZ65_010488 [Modicella reniformis]|uniref:Uncharacterized protein n=1 Tax=Modicella reniformis TaxID=1440133 RepID=A0A9P6LTG9_9FUNG|nr:hypothetical protein BGZ65_010488 [Modicella reniformis]
MSNNHRMLYDVALSGIINVRMYDVNFYFDDKVLNTIKAQCFRDDFCRPEKVPGLSQILKELNESMRQFISAEEVDYNGLSLEAICLRAKDIKKKKPVDPIRTALLDTIDYLSSDFFSGEIPSRATKFQSSSLGLELNIDMAKGAGARKLDMQC